MKPDPIVKTAKAVTVETGWKENAHYSIVRVEVCFWAAADAVSLYAPFVSFDDGDDIKALEFADSLIEARRMAIERIEKG